MLVHADEHAGEVAPEHPERDNGAAEQGSGPSAMTQKVRAARSGTATSQTLGHPLRCCCVSQEEC